MEVRDTGKIYGLYLEGSPETIRYVGKTASRKGLQGRLYEHLWLAKNSEGKLPVQRWINKNGSENIRVVELEDVPAHLLNQREIETIADFRARGMADLNVTGGGDGRTSEEVSGERNPRAKTTSELVELVRGEALKRYVTVLEASKILGVSTIGASKVLTNRSWHNPKYDPGKRVTPQESARHGGKTAWGRPRDEDVEALRQRYLEGETIPELVKRTGIPSTSVRRYLFEKYGSEATRIRCREFKQSQK